MSINYRFGLDENRKVTFRDSVLATAPRLFPAGA